MTLKDTRVTDPIHQLFSVEAKGHVKERAGYLFVSFQQFATGKRGGGSPF